MSPTYRATFTSDLKNVALARNAIASFARLCGFSDEEIIDIRLACGEALSNAAEHGRGERGGGFSVRCGFENDEFAIDIQDSGAGFDEESAAINAPDHRGRGFGLTIMRQLMDDVRFSRNGTHVHMTKRVPAARAGSTVSSSAAPETP